MTAVPPANQPPVQPPVAAQPPVVYPPSVAPQGYVQHPAHTQQQPYVQPQPGYVQPPQGYAPPQQQGYAQPPQGYAAPPPNGQVPYFPNGSQGAPFAPSTGLKARVRGNWGWAFVLFGFPLLLIPIGIVILIWANIAYRS